MTNNGRAKSLPFWFSAIGRWLDPWRECSLELASWSVGDFRVVQSGYMGLAGTRFYFAEPSGADNEAGSGGPVLVMSPAKEPKRPHRWLQRLWLVVFVLFCLEVGIILTVLPWTRLWAENSLLLGFPAVKEFVNHGFVRGLVSGLGLIDIWMGVVEAVTYRESSRN